MKLLFATANADLDISTGGSDVRMKVTNKVTGAATILYLDKVEAKTLATALLETAKGLAK